MKKYLFLLLLFCFASIAAFSQEATIYGKIQELSGTSMQFVNVSVKGKAIGTSTHEDGYYELKVPANQEIVLVFSNVGFKTVEQKLILKPGERKQIDLSMESTSEEIDQVTIEDKQVRKSTLNRLDPKIMSVIPELSGNIEGMIKTLPGVSSNNELSSQYSVRGGNFDENLIYVNDIEIYRPLLIRSGEQEGLSFVNSDMVSSVLFSAGGFDVRYGDKMSSVLDIKYKKPVGWGGSFSVSKLGGSVMMMGDSRNHRFRHITGIRYRTTKYVLKSLETQGEYDPRFIDLQTYLSYDLTDKLELSFLGNYSQNRYHFVPGDRTTKFGTVHEAYELRMFFEGEELDQFDSFTGAIALDYKINDRFNMKLITSVFNSNERETFDILSQYWINELDNDLGSASLGDSIANLGVGSFLRHARNYLDARVYSVEHKGIYSANNQFIQWGVKAQQEKIDDNLTEWKMIDSAGFSLPYTDTSVSLDYYIRGNNHLNSERFTAYLQDTYTLNLEKGELNFTGGIRAGYWNFNKELIISPRFNVAFKPDWEKDIVFKFSTGYYYQPPFYKEMRTLKGTINPDIHSQKSIHFVLGTDYNFKAWNRPFKFVTEAYYKVLKDLISYSVDNVRDLYSGYNDADGYAAGLDMKVNGEFVKGVDSWFSLSILKTEENIRNDQYVKDGQVIYPGYIPRPSDQRVNVGIFFQDYFPGNPDYRMQLQVNFGSGLPFGPPNSPRYEATHYMKSYQRVDIGFSKILKREGKTYPKGHILHSVKDAWISFEVFNLMDRLNVISYEWVKDYSGKEYAVENNLTRRRLNLKLTAQF